MGMITGVLTLPLAPVRGVAWVANKLAEQAYEEGFSEAAVRSQLIAAQRELEAGRLGEEEYDAIEDLLVQRLAAARAPSTWPGV